MGDMESPLRISGTAPKFSNLNLKQGDPLPLLRLESTESLNSRASEKLIKPIELSAKMRREQSMTKLR